MACIFSGRYILPDDYKIVEYTEICSKFLDASMKSVITRLYIISLALVAMAALPSHAVISKNIKVTGIDARVPFTDERSSGEFFGNALLQLVLVLWGSVGFVGSICFWFQLNLCLRVQYFLCKF